MLRKLATLTAFLIVIGVSGSGWYVRTYLQTGNPVWPLSFVWNDEIIFQGVPDPKYRTDRFPGHHIPDGLKDRLEQDKWGTILYSWRHDPWENMCEACKWGGVGAVLAVFGVPAVIITICSYCMRRRWGIITFIACWLFSYALFPFPTWARFSLPVLTVVLVCIGSMLEVISDKKVDME